MFSSVPACYLYDGSFEGFLCCVFESYEKKETPSAILAEQHAPPSFWEERYIPTDKDKAARVYLSLSKKMSPYAERLVTDSFLTCLPDKELHILTFLQLGFVMGPRVTDLLTDPRVAVLTKAVLHLDREANHYMGFVRFSVSGDYMAAIIEPKNYVLPVIAGHFCNRYNSYHFLIYDKTHGSALIYTNGVSHFRDMEDFVLPPADESQQAYEQLWRAFYQAIAIQGRINPRCRMTMMPKRFWGPMPEMQGEV